MSEHRQTTPPNSLRLHRRRNGLSQREVARTLGLRSAAAISRYERGVKQPSLSSALKLEIVYHTPVAFLFDELYQQLREEIHAPEERLADTRTHEPKVHPLSK